MDSSEAYNYSNKYNTELHDDYDTQMFGLIRFDNDAYFQTQAIQRAEIGQNLRLPSSIGTAEQFPTSQYGYTDYSSLIANPYQPPTSSYVPGRVNLPSSLPGQSPTVNNPNPYAGFDPTNPGAGLPYNTFGGTP